MLRARALALLALPALLAALGSCEFHPKARRAKPRLISAGATRVVRSLDAVGAYVLIRDERAGTRRTAIYGWQKDARCELPSTLERVGRPLPRPAGARKGPVFWLPVVLHERALIFVDERCTPHASAIPVEPDSLQNVFSLEDGRGALVFQDGVETFVFDPWGLGEPLALAGPTEDVQPAYPEASKRQDALWLLEDGVLSQRSWTGAPRVTLGEQVSAFALSPAGPRVAFVDDGTLYEAVGPAFRPKRLAADACLPRYGEGVLDFLSPCAEGRLQRRELASGELVGFAGGVFASVTREGVQLDYVQTDETTVELFAQSPRFARRRVEPPFDPEQTYVLDQRRVAGLSADGSFGSWEGGDGTFRALLHGADTVLPHYRGKKHEHWWLVHHEMTDGLGALSVLNEADLQPRRLADGVPARDNGGFRMERGGGLPNYPFSEPFVLVLEQAVPLTAEPERFKGRLRALLLSGEPSAELAADVSSYQLVAVPVPGVLYGIEEGPDQGLWFAEL
jgi:hypothetical protein